jgi:hypothetical protein
MYWWVSHGDQRLLDHGTCNQSGWMTEREALKCANDAILRGWRAIGITGPSGETWDEKTIIDKLGDNVVHAT